MQTKNMRRKAGPTPFLIIVVSVSLFALTAVAYWLCREETHKAPDIVDVSRGDSVLSKDVNLATSMADIPALRDVGLDGDDIEVRVWRSFSLPTQEGVLLKRVRGQWSGHHIFFKTDERGDVLASEVVKLKPPKIGWELFWGKLVEKGILLLPITPENECDFSVIDGQRYFVEISQNNMYRNYQYSENHFECRESRQMTEIGEIIGVEFDTGQEACKRYEWFACMTERNANKNSGTPAPRRLKKKNSAWPARSFQDFSFS